MGSFLRAREARGAIPNSSALTYTALHLYIVERPLNGVIKRIIIAVILVAAVLGAVFYLGSNPWVEQEDEGQGARFAIFAILKDGSEVPLSGDGFDFQPNSIKHGGQVISALKAIIQVRGSSPDYDEYRLTASSYIQFRIGWYVAGSPPTYDWFSTNQIIGTSLFVDGDRIMPFDNIWRNVPDKAFQSPSGYEIDSSFNLIIPASFIQEAALADGGSAPATIIFDISYHLAWDVPEDSAFVSRTLDETFVGSLALVEGEAGLEGDIVVGDILS